MVAGETSIICLLLITEKRTQHKGLLGEERAEITPKMFSSSTPESKILFWENIQLCAENQQEPDSCVAVMNCSDVHERDNVPGEMCDLVLCLLRLIFSFQPQIQLTLTKKGGEG